MLKIPLQIAKLFPKKERVIGLDMGCASIKLAQFSQKDAKLTLKRLKIQEIDCQKDTRQAQLDALKSLFKDINTQEAQVKVVINCPQSTTRILTIPFMPKSEIPEALKWEMKNFVSFNVEEAALDYEILQEVIQAGVKKLKVCVACSPQATINNYLGLLKEAGIHPALFTQPAFALKNIITNFLPEEEQTIGILDIGCGLSELYLFQAEEFVFNRKLPVAGQNFTQDMSQVLVSDLGKTQLTPQEAEEIKKKCGIPETASSDVLEGKISCVQLVSLLRPNLEKLAKEIERSFDFYREKEQGGKVEHLILLGGSSSLKGLAKNLTEELGIPIDSGNPLKGLVSEESALFKDNAASAHRFAQSLGVAKSAAHAVNLLPVEIKEQTRLLIERSSIKAAVTAVIAILILTYIGMNIRLGVYDKRIAAARLELGALAPHIGEVQKQAFLATALKERIYWSDALKEISNLIPAQVCLTSLNTQKKSLILKGEIKSSGMAEQKILTEFMNLLERGIFKEVNLVSTKKGLSQDRPYTFELRLVVE